MKKVTKKERKLLKGGNAMVQYSVKGGQKLGEYIGRLPVFHNKAKMGQPADYVKVVSGLPFIRKELHNL